MAERRPVTLRQVRDQQQSEAEFTVAVADLAKLMGWEMYHPLRSEGSTPGFPDWTFLKPGRLGELGQLVFAELKTETGRVSVAQQRWIEGLQTVNGITAGIYRPSDWLALERVLRGGR